MQTIHFNTRRSYTVHGQRITATLHDDGVVTFWDHDRMVHGEFFHSMPNLGASLTQDDVMRVYDRGQHDNSTRSWRDGMLRGGVNSKYEG